MDLKFETFAFLKIDPMIVFLFYTMIFFAFKIFKFKATWVLIHIANYIEHSYKYIYGPVAASEVDNVYIM